MTERVEGCVQKVRDLGHPVEVVEAYWCDADMCWLAKVGVVVRCPSLEHPEFSARELTAFDPSLVPALDSARDAGRAIADALGAPFWCEAGDTPAAHTRWMATRPLEERDWVLRWRALALHCSHESPEPPVELSGDVTVRAIRPGGALNLAREHALAQLPHGDGWKREAEVRLTIDGHSLVRGRVTRPASGDSEL